MTKVTREVGPEVDFLREYAGKHWPMGSQRGAREAKSPMAKFVGVSADTIYRWLAGTNAPLGFPLVKLRYFLEAAGYKVPALTQLKKSAPTIYNLGEIIVYGLISVDRATEHLKYRNPGAILNRLHGESAISKERDLQIKTLCALHEADLKEKRAALKKLASNTEQVEEPQVKKVEVPVVPKLIDSQMTQVAKQAIIEAVGHGLLGLLPFVKLVASDNFTSEDRKYLREIIGYEVVGNMADAIRQLTSETARKQLLGNGGK